MSSESCNSRHFSWLMKSCFPNPHDPATALSPNPIHTITTATTAATLSSLPDDLLLECLSRVPPSSLPYISLVCRRWSSLIRSPSFLILRRLHNLLHPTIFAFSSSNSTLFAASLRFEDISNHINLWKVTFCLPFQLDTNIVHCRLCSIGPRIYIICRNGLLFCFDTWSRKLSTKAPITHSRKKFASAVLAGKIYVAGGGSRAADSVEEYDPDSDTWSIIAHAPRKRFGCIGAAVDGVFYVIGGLKIGNGIGNDISRAATAGAEAHVYASSMDLYDVEAAVWLRSRAVPGGGCVVAACSAAGFVFILASHAVELSFWRFDARRHGNVGGFGEWCRIKSPPLPAQVRVDSTVRFSFVGVEDKVVLIQVVGCIDDLLRRSGRNMRGLKERLVLVYDCASGEWSRGPDLPEVIRRATCVTVEC